MDPASAAAALTSIKAGVELTKVILAAKSQVERQAAVAQLNQQLLNAQNQALEANEVIRLLRIELDELRAKGAQADTWESTVAKYEQFAVGGGNLVYRPRDGVEGLANHYACANCFNERKLKSLSVTKMASGRRTAFSCSTCQSAFAIDGNPPPLGSVPKTVTAFNRP